MRLFKVLLLPILFAIFAGGCGQDNDIIVLKLAHGLDVTHPVHRAMLFMGERLVEKSGGRIRLEVFPAEQLGSEREMIEQVQLGCIDMTKTSISVLENFVPAMSVFSLPYVFRDDDHLWKVLNGPVGQRLKQAGAAVGLTGLCYYDAGSRSFYTKDRSIMTPADLAGLKIRVQQSRTSMDMVRAVGASPTPIAFGELYTALQQGIVDGAENNPPSLYTSRHYEICKYYSLDEHTMVPDILLISEVVWRRFDPETRRIIQEAADESVIYQRQLWKEFTEESMREVENAGVTIEYPDKTLFREAVSGMLGEYTGTEIGELIDEIQRTE